MIAVTTPTGRIGSQVVDMLLAANEKVRVVARHPEKLPPAWKGRVEVVEGALDDDEALARAFTGAESVFLVVPPSFRTPDYRAHYLELTRAAIRSMKAEGVTRAVGVSALGVGYKGDAGVVSASHEKDEEFRKAGIDYRALWCPGFMDNLLSAVPQLKATGAFSWPLDPRHKTRHCSTGDIARMGVKLLRDRSWTGQGGVGVLGTEDQSFDDLAAIMTEVLGTPIRFQPVSPDAFKQQLLQHGASASMAEGLVRMFAAKKDGMDEAEPRTAENTTPTSFRTWCEDVLKPAFTAS